MFSVIWTRYLYAIIWISIVGVLIRLNQRFSSIINQYLDFNSLKTVGKSVSCQVHIFFFKMISPHSFKMNKTVKKAYLQAWIHEKRLKRFNKVFMAAQFPRILDNSHVSPIGVCCSNEVKIHTCIFLNWQKKNYSKLNQVKLHNNIKDYPWKNKILINLLVQKKYSPVSSVGRARDF